MFEELEKLADQSDRATRGESIFNEEALARHRLDNAEEPHPEFDGRHCIEPDCQDEIPEGRLATGAVRCIHCQSRKEERLKCFAHLEKPVRATA